MEVVVYQPAEFLVLLFQPGYLGFKLFASEFTHDVPLTAAMSSVTACPSGAIVLLGRLRSMRPFSTGHDATQESRTFQAAARNLSTSDRRASSAALVTLAMVDSSEPGLVRLAPLSEVTGFHPRSFLDRTG